MMKFVLVLFLLAAVALAGTTEEDKIVIDDFSIEQSTIIIRVGTGDQQVSNSQTASESNIIGGERNMFLSADGGANNAVLTSGVNQGEWSVSTPNGADGFSALQWDGTDDTIGLDTSGLSVDFTQDNGVGFRVELESDLPTSFLFIFYERGAASDDISCQFTQQIPGGQNSRQKYEIDFTDFPNSCNFANIGAIEVEVDQAENVDALMSEFVSYGLVPDSPTPTPTTTPTPSPCSCSCPSFACELVLDDVQGYYRTYFLYPNRDYCDPDDDDDDDCNGDNDIDVGDIDVGDIDVGDIDVGDIDVGDIDVGDIGDIDDDNGDDDNGDDDNGDDDNGDDDNGDDDNGDDDDGDDDIFDDDGCDDDDAAVSVVASLLLVAAAVLALLI